MVLLWTFWRSRTRKNALASRCPFESGMAPLPWENGTLRKMENSGNEAKKYLKTKESRFLNAANCARFARKLTPIGPQMEKNSSILRRRSQGSGIARQGQSNDTLSATQARGSAGPSLRSGQALKLIPWFEPGQRALAVLLKMGRAQYNEAMPT